MVAAVMMMVAAVSLAGSRLTPLGAMLRRLEQLVPLEHPPVQRKRSIRLILTSWMKTSW